MLFKSVLSVALFAVSALAKIALTTYPSAVAAGSTYTISWTGGDDTPVTLILRKGEPTNLLVVGTITTTGTGGSYSWTAPSTYAPGTDYAFEIQQSGDNNYSTLITYTGGVAAVSSSAVPSVASSYPPSIVTSSFSGYPTYQPSVHYNGTNITSAASASTITSIYVASTSAQLTTSLTKPTATPATVPSNMGSTVKSPLALIFGAIAAMIYLQ